MTLAEKQDELLRELRTSRDPQERLAWLIDRARERALLPPELRTDANLVPGCLARLWFAPSWRDGKCFFRAESDSLIVKAVAGLLCDFFSGRTPEEILTHEGDFLRLAGISEHLTPNRRNGLGRVRGLIHDFAQNHRQ